MQMNSSDHIFKLRLLFVDEGKEMMISHGDSSFQEHRYICDSHTCSLVNQTLALKCFLSKYYTCRATSSGIHFLIGLSDGCPVFGRTFGCQYEERSEDEGQSESELTWCTVESWARWQHIQHLCIARKHQHWARQQAISVPTCLLTYPPPTNSTDIRD